MEEVFASRPDTSLPGTEDRRTFVDWQHLESNPDQLERLRRGPKLHPDSGKEPNQEQIPIANIPPYEYPPVDGRQPDPVTQPPVQFVHGPEQPEGYGPGTHSPTRRSSHPFLPARTRRVPEIPREPAPTHDVPVEFVDTNPISHPPTPGQEERIRNEPTNSMRNRVRKPTQERTPILKPLNHFLRRDRHHKNSPNIRRCPKFHRIFRSRHPN